MYHDLNISEEEKSTLKKAIIWVTLLISASDGKINDEELDWAEKIAKIRGYNNPEKLSDFYDEVGLNFSAELQAEMEGLPKSSEEIISGLTEKIQSLNPILAKLDRHTASEYYKSYVTFAEHVAKSSGGVLRFFSVSTGEKKLMDLPMLTPIEYS